MLQELSKHLDQALNGGEVDTELVTDAVDRLTLDKSPQDARVVGLVAQRAVQLLYEAQDIDFQLIVALLEALLLHLPFEAITHLFPVSQLAAALQSPASHIQSLGLRVVAKASPVDIIANTEIVPLCIRLVAEPSTDVAVVSDFERTMDVLLTGELIRRRVLSSEVITILRTMKTEVTLLMRLYDFLVKLLPLTTAGDVPSDLFQITEWCADEFWILATLQFYTTLLGSTHEDLTPSIKIICENYSEDPLSGSYFSALLAKLSYTLDLQELDAYILPSIRNLDLLGQLNPEYLVSNHTSLIKSLPPLSQSTAHVYANLFKSPRAFGLTKEQLKSSYLTRCTYIELLGMVYALTNYAHSAQYLLQNHPAIMNRLINPRTEIIETEAFQLRRDCLENLINCDLGIWKSRVLNEWDKVTKGRRLAPGVEIMDATM